MLGLVEDQQKICPDYFRLRSETGMRESMVQTRAGGHGMTRVHRICTGCMSTIQLARVLLNRATRVACFWTRLSVSSRFMASVRVVVSLYPFLRPSEDNWNPGIVTSLPVKVKGKREAK